MEQIEFDYEFEAIDCVLTVEATIEPGEPARTYGPPEHCDPGYGPNIFDITAVMGDDQHEVDLDSISITKPDPKSKVGEPPKWVWVTLKSVLEKEALEQWERQVELERDAA